MKPTFTRFEAEPAAGMTPSDFTPPETFTTSDQSETNHTFFASDDESILAGVWESAPCREVIDPYPVHEMMTVVSGSVTLTSLDEDGNLYRRRLLFRRQGHPLHLGNHRDPAQVLLHRVVSIVATAPRLPRHTATGAAAG